jgi:Carboxypeptidase regulatory-like domain
MGFAAEFLEPCAAVARQTRMRRICGILLLCAPLAAQNVGRITGTVLDSATNQPIAKVHVGSVTGDPGSNAFVGALTQADGTYTLENVPAGAVRITVNLEGYKFVADPPGRDAGFRLSAGETMRRDYVLHRRVRIYGHLRDRETGEPIEGHLVIATRMEARPAYPGQPAYLEFPASQKGAEFEIPDLDSGLYYLKIESNAQPVFEFSGEASLKRPPEKVYGESWYPGVARRELAMPIRLAEGESRAIDIALASRDTHSISGAVEAPREMAEQPMTLILQKDGINGAVGAMPAPGEFRIDNLAPGSYRLYAIGGAPPGGSSNLRDYAISVNNSANRPPAVNAVGYAQFEIGDREIDNLKLVIGPYAGVAGEVRMLEEDEKVPAAFGVLLVPSWPSGAGEFPPPPGMVMTSRVAQVTAGGFHQDWLLPGHYWPRASNLPEGYAVAQILAGGARTDGLVQVDSPQTPITLVITSHPGVVAGVVRDSDQNAVPGSTVALFPEPLTDRTDRARIQGRISAKDGSFAFRDLPPGRYRAIVLTDGEMENEMSPAVLRKKAEGTETIELAAGQTVTVDLKR